jgi:hypothetical protein
MARVRLVLLRWRIRLGAVLPIYSKWVAVSLWPVAYFVPPYLLKIGHHPPVGMYIAIMGVLAAMVSLRKEPSPTEKAAWIVLITLVMIAEVRNLYVADREETDKFTAIQNGLELTNEGLAKTATALGTTATTLHGISGDISKESKQSQAQFGATIEKLNKGIDAEIGGSSFAYVEFYGYPPLDAMLKKHGDTPLYDLNVKVTEIAHCENQPILSPGVPCSSHYSLANETFGNFPVGSHDLPFRLSTLPPPSSGGPGDLDHISLLIEFSARNGTWKEMYWAHRLPESTRTNIRYEQAIRVYKQTTDARGRTISRIVYSRIQPNFPREMMEFDVVQPR